MRTLHLVLEIAAFFFGFRYYLYLRKRSGDAISEQNRSWIIAGAAAGALIGSRLLGAFEDPQWTAHPHWQNVFLAFNNKSIVGGLFGGTLGVELVKKILGEKQRSGDLFVFPILLALMIGRLGCLLNAQEDHTAGGPTSLPWGIDYGDGIHRHPLPLYELLFLGALFFILRKIQQRQLLASGALFKLMMIAYFLYRIVNESLK